MDAFKWFLAVDITLVSLAIAAVIFRLFFLVKKTENVLEEARKTIYLANIELPRLVREFEGAIGELKDITFEIKGVIHGINNTVTRSFLGQHQGSGPMASVGYTAFHLLPQINRVKNIVGAAVVAYKTVNAARKIIGFIKKKIKRR